MTPISDSELGRLCNNRWDRSCDHKLVLQCLKELRALRADKRELVEALEFVQETVDGSYLNWRARIQEKLSTLIAKHKEVLSGLT